MLTRPGASPGPSWMRNLSELATTDPRQLRRKLMWIFVFFGILQIGSIIIGDIAVYRAHGRHVQSYNSQIQIAGLPLLSIGGRAHGIIAYGGLATGFIAMGGVSAGVIAFGGLSVGVFAFGGLSLGIVALGGAALGWRAIGGVAIGNAAFGALAIGRHAYAGEGIALGRDEASGKQKESLFG
jgi:hypothetical protein